MGRSIGGALRDKMTDKIGKNRLIEAKEVGVQTNNTRSLTTAAVVKANLDRSNKIAALTEVRQQDFC